MHTEACIWGVVISQANADLTDLMNQMKTVPEKRIYPPELPLSGRLSLWARACQSQHGKWDLSAWYCTLRERRKSWGLTQQSWLRQRTLRSRCEWILIHPSRDTGRVNGIMGVAVLFSWNHGENDELLSSSGWGCSYNSNVTLDYKTSQYRSRTGIF